MTAAAGQVVMDKVRNRASLVATAALSWLCPAQRPAGVTMAGCCLLRYDIQASRAPARTRLGAFVTSRHAPRPPAPALTISSRKLSESDCAPPAGSHGR